MKINKMTSIALSLVFYGFLGANSIDDEIFVYQETFAEGDSPIDRAVSREMPQQFEQNEKVELDAQNNADVKEESAQNIKEEMSQKSDDIFNDDLNFNISKEALDSLTQEFNSIFNKAHTQLNNFFEQIKSKLAVVDNNVSQTPKTQENIEQDQATAPHQTEEQKAQPTVAAVDNIAQAPAEKVSDKADKTDSTDVKAQDTSSVDNSNFTSTPTENPVDPLANKEKQENSQPQIQDTKFTITAQQSMIYGAFFVAAIGGGYIAYQYFYAPEQETCDEKD